MKCADCGKEPHHYKVSTDNFKFYCTECGKKHILEEIKKAYPKDKFYL